MRLTFRAGPPPFVNPSWKLSQTHPGVCFINLTNISRVCLLLLCVCPPACVHVSEATCTRVDEEARRTLSILFYCLILLTKHGAWFTVVVLSLPHSTEVTVCMHGHALLPHTVDRKSFLLFSLNGLHGPAITLP